MKFHEFTCVNLKQQTWNYLRAEIFLIEHEMSQKKISKNVIPTVWQLAISFAAIAWEKDPSDNSNFPSRFLYRTQARTRALTWSRNSKVTNARRVTRVANCTVHTWRLTPYNIVSFDPFNLWGSNPFSWLILVASLGLTSIRSAAHQQGTFSLFFSMAPFRRVLFWKPLYLYVS